ncbi:MAG: hypothetical protein L6R42_005649 [Xanthoria sp. 1 TBL-2021]|nr:MAG: hypothetical protein L6R42_005649 [Xanthoria sp. 1 TBL-2021]
MTIGDEFTGLTLRTDDVFRRIQFTTEHIGIFAIAALKEEALLEYNDPLTDFDFMDRNHPGPPLRLVIQAETPYILHAKVRRSTVMWAIGAIAVDMMRNLHLYPLSFQVFHHAEHIYSGSVRVENSNGAPANLPENDSPLAPRALSIPLPLAGSPTKSPNNFLLRNISRLEDQPRFDLSFTFIYQQGSLLQDYYILRALIAVLLQLAKADAASTQRRIGTTRRDLQAWVFMEDSRPLAATHHFQQYQAVAVVEAIARYYGSHGQYREMTFALRADGQLLAIGCVSKAVSTRQWCRGLYSLEDSAISENLDQVAETS